MATLHKEELGFGFYLELRDTALIYKPYAVEFSRNGFILKPVYFSNYPEALDFFDFKVLEIKQILGCFLKLED